MRNDTMHDGRFAPSNRIDTTTTDTEEPHNHEQQPKFRRL